MDIPTISLITGAVSGAVASIDKIYRGYADFMKARKGNVFDTPPDFRYQDKPDEKTFVAVSRHTGQEYQKVTYEDLCNKLNLGDKEYVETLSKALRNLERQWNAAYEDWSMASGMDRGRYEAQLETLAPRIAEPLLKVLEFVQQMGLWLDDHYHAARMIAQEYLREKEMDGAELPASK